VFDVREQSNFGHCRAARQEHLSERNDRIKEIHPHVHFVHANDVVVHNPLATGPSNRSFYTLPSVEILDLKPYNL